MPPPYSPTNGAPPWFKENTLSFACPGCITNAQICTCLNGMCSACRRLWSSKLSYSFGGRGERGGQFWPLSKWAVFSNCLDLQQKMVNAKILHTKVIRSKSLAHYLAIKLKEDHLLYPRWYIRFEDCILDWIDRGVEHIATLATWGSRIRESRRASVMFNKFNDDFTKKLERSTISFS